MLEKEVFLFFFKSDNMRSKMDLVSGYKGVVGLMFGNDDSTSSDDSYVERLLDRINNGTKAEDRRTALTELQSVVAESHVAQLAFGAMGFPVMISVLKEDRGDVEMVQGALETLLGALTPLNYAKALKNDVQPATMNADLLSREADSISLLFVSMGLIKARYPLLFRLDKHFRHQDLLSRNANLAEDLVKTGRVAKPRPGSGPDMVQVDTLLRELQEATQRVEILKAEKAKIESEATMYRNLAGKVESDLKSLSNAYNSLEQVNFQLEREMKDLKAGGGDSSYSDIKAIKAEAREEAQKESETELNDLLVCLGQEQSKVERLSTRLEELGEDVDNLVEGVGDESVLPVGEDEDEDGE